MERFSRFDNFSVNDEKYTPNYAVLPILKYLPKKQSGVRSIQRTANLFLPYKKISLM